MSCYDNEEMNRHGMDKETDMGWDSLAKMKGHLYERTAPDCIPKGPAAALKALAQEL
jgi:hypothetical protein